MVSGSPGPVAGAHQGRVLVIAGSDPSGGAGIQADIKTITALRGYAATALTALTVQNTQGVTDVMPIPAAFVKSQMEAVLSDIGADMIKTGMLHDAQVMASLVICLKEANFTGGIVVDPVMVATSGDILIETKAIAYLKEHLLPIASLITPNIPEAAILTGIDIETVSDLQRAGEILLGMGPRAVLLKGGHLTSDWLVDTLLTQDGGIVEIESRRLHTRHTHGTGCTLASAIATGLARGDGLELAFRRGHAFVREAIEKAPGFGQGNGPLGHSAVCVDRILK